MAIPGVYKQDDVSYLEYLRLRGVALTFMGIANGLENARPGWCLNYRSVGTTCLGFHAYEDTFVFVAKHAL